MAKQTWEFKIDDIGHKVELEHPLVFVIVTIISRNKKYYNTDE